MNGTSSSVPGWYMNFLAAVIMQLPRPDQMDQEVGEGWTNNQASLKKNLAGCLLPPAVSKKLTPELLLEPVGTVTISATAGRFVARDKFVINTSASAKVKISYLGDNFKSWFLEGDGKIEELIGEQTLRYAKLRKSSVDGPIISELGGETKAETALAEMFSLMKEQANGEAGILLNNGYANIFYVHDLSGVLRTVDVFWYGDGWYVFASAVENPFRWDDGSQVFSRKPLETLAA